MSEKTKDYPFTETGLFPNIKNLPKNHEYEWDKVQRERKENHPKFLGGNYVATPKGIDSSKLL